MIPTLVVAYVAISLSIIGRRVYLDRKAQPRFPSVDEVEIQYQERWASGCSDLSWFTRIGGARNCLHATVTKDELWIRPQLFVSLFAAQLDLCHRIGLSRLIDAQLHDGNTLELKYPLGDGSERKFTLELRQPGKFMSALQSALDTRNAEPADARESPS